MIEYHDHEWGVPVFDDRKLFEFFVLDAFQAGLSWATILKKRENFRLVFDNFEPSLISDYTEKKIQELMGNPGIIRNELKIRSTVKNAVAFLKIVHEHGSFSKYIWSFVNNKPVVNQWGSMMEVPATSSISDLMSKELKKQGFNFVGSTICYSFMQAAGLVNDHTTNCFCYEEIKRRFQE
jgi:DNA-3-methyladenine glycosylase I